MQNGERISKVINGKNNCSMNEDILFLHAIFSSYQRVLQADVKKNIITQTNYETKLNNMRKFRDNFALKLKNNLNFRKL